MAATTKLLQLRPKLPITTTTTSSTSTSSSFHFFFSSTTPDPDSTPSSTQPNPPPPLSPPSQSQSQSSFSSYFSDLKASLKQHPQRNPQQSQPPRKPLSYASSISNQPNSPSKIESLEEIRRNLSGFRLRSAVPPPSPPPPPSSSSSNQSPQSPQHISFQELFQRNVASKGEGSNPNASSSAGKFSFDAIRESLRQLKVSPLRNQSQGGGRMNDPISLARFNESLKMRQTDPNAKTSQHRVFGGSDPLPLSIFGPEMKEKEEGGSSSDATMRTEFVRMYSLQELGQKLRVLRPEKRDKKDWFSLEELNERLVKLRVMEENESNSNAHGVSFKDLRDGLRKLSLKEQEDKKTPMHRLDILGQLGRTPSYMLSPPKEELVEKYFHPDNMSASEKMKLELMKVRDEFKMSESDCGSARVQVAQLTTRIKHLATALHKKDKHSRKGLEAMVQRRKKLLKYLRRTDWDSYCFVLSKLGLRDNAADPAKKKNYPNNPAKKKAIKH